jgi:hypothetical protein
MVIGQYYYTSKSIKIATTTYRMPKLLSALRETPGMPSWNLRVPKNPLCKTVM